jgi:transposase
MDNARIHHSKEIDKLVGAYGEFYRVFTSVYLYCIGCHIEYLPPYSPDYNLIEQAFSAIKSHLRRNGISFFEDHALYYELYRACEVITLEMTWGFFSHAGYL